MSLDATNDVIVGTAKGYGWKDLENYAVSLAASGFRGRKVMFINTLTQAAKDTLTKLGFELVEYTSTAGNTVYERFRVLRDWLNKEIFNIRYIIHCDVRDVVIQTDPSAWMEKQTTRLFGASEFILYRNEMCNPEWVKKLYGDQTLASLANEEVICAGTIAGEAKAVLQLVTEIYGSCTDRFGDDQAALNVLLRNEFKNEMRIPTWDEGFILTAGWWLIGRVNGNPDQLIGQKSHLGMNPPQLKDGVAYPYGSDKPYCIVHQYERGNEWAPLISKHYHAMAPAVADDTAQTTAAVRRRRAGPLKYAKDGLTLDWFDMHDVG
jgi:hypothetical protein